MPKQEMKDLRISLTPHGVVLGRVVDEDGDPRVGVQVTANKPEWQGNKRQMVAYGDATTNDLGEYRTVRRAAGELRDPGRAAARDAPEYAGAERPVRSRKTTT